MLVVMEVFETRDRDLLRQTFRRDPIAAIYQLGDLEPPVFEKCRWFAAAEAGHVLGVLLLYADLDVPVVLPLGDRAALQAIEADCRPQLPECFYTKLSEEQRDLFKVWRTVKQEPIAVMGLNKFQGAPASQELRLRRIGPGVSTNELMEVYRHYPGNYFHPSHLECGVYVGGYVNGELAAIAGTHAFAPGERAAVVGNIVTADSFRGRGYCQACTGFLVEQLLAAGCRHVGLHVSAENQPAIHCYRKLGFTIHSLLLQTLLERM